MAARNTRAKEQKAREVTYLLELKNGEQRKVTVPASWRVTFGPTVPFERKNTGSYRDELWALRFYDGKDLKAIFTDVRSFRDMSINILEKQIRTQRQVFNKDGKKGGKAVVAEAKMESWVDPDNPDDTLVPDDFTRLEFNPETDVEDGDLW